MPPCFQRGAAYLEVFACSSAASPAYYGVHKTCWFSGHRRGVIARYVTPKVTFFSQNLLIRLDCVGGWGYGRCINARIRGWRLQPARRIRSRG